MGVTSLDAAAGSPHGATSPPPSLAQPSPPNLVVLLVGVGTDQSRDLAPLKLQAAKNVHVTFSQMGPKGHILKAHFYPEPKVITK